MTTLDCRIAIGSLDHIVGTTEQCEWDGEAERVGSLEVDDQLDLGRLHHRHWCDPPSSLSSLKLDAACDPSAEQLELAQQISEYLEVPIPEEALCFRDLMSDFIAEYLHSFHLTRAIEAKVIDL